VRVLISLVLCLFVSLSVWAGGYSDSVTDTSLKIIPAAIAQPRTISAWTSGTVVAGGEYLRNPTDGIVYMAVVGGTSTSSISEGVTSDGLTWRKTSRTPVPFVGVLNEGPGSVYLGLGEPAESGLGLALGSNDFVCLSNPDGAEVFVISAEDATNTVISWQAPFGVSAFGSIGE